MTPRFSGLPFFVYPVSDMPRARAFYRGVLGLTESANWGDKWVEFEVGSPDGPALAISTEIGGAIPGSTAAAAALEAIDFDAAIAHLRAQNISIIFGPADSGVCHFARFTDPDGNHLVLHRHHPPAAS
ncbi:VOC family protein [Horticoccus luteus]|uniref:VOC family protein n=1 Tax=Horticoccus luteus TaxID=2862869 RepID=A0A8F9TS22_9BACT|nr:VOC family protein [Horticoccus luteus]QYM78164.1 VOC family protein [Horticoccus luteus]